MLPAGRNFLGFVQLTCLLREKLVMAFLNMFTDWRFLCAVAFFGAVVGTLLYSVTPLKIKSSSRGGQDYLKEMMRTGLGDNVAVSDFSRASLAASCSTVYCSQSWFYR